jgi:hypothetical protein
MLAMGSKQGKYKLKDGIAEEVAKGTPSLNDDAADLTHDELFGDQLRKDDLDTSQTDEGENEGLGDGNIGRSENPADE